MELCPCGSKKSYADCCQPYISGVLPAPTAEALMRSRYSAYVKQEIEYIESTHGQDGREDVDVEETRKWAAESEWKGLKIVSSQKGGENDTTGIVEFIASYVQKGTKYDHHEVSQFEKVDGRWYFKDGQVKDTTVVRTEAKVGRNDPCPCGSGKKYKKCCGA